ncbi:tetratricopeptide repeat protein [Trinickia caryophylli]|nr:tetratricopeptide repeat protein [Trinickia caryophylli]PMS11849.1 sel1 repeat family protein [Trinickia caryophylli]TRX15355.1 sel1 repeat family protein [Trinickia caryophylli]WQE15701.1 tetratricopeptide repeat protein [Trinickia caryophylli]
MSELPRYEKLPPFNPHRKAFTCVYQDQHVPAVDPQAEQWFQQALALDDPDIFYQKRDYPKIYQLYTQAAERNHWRAMLNLASLILSDYAVPEHDPEVAIRWVEKAMKLKVPDAYDVMGVYHQNGLVKGGGATSAYAFFQRAAELGSPAAMTFLGDKLAATYDDPSQGFWSNVPVATEMLQCALAQGYGDAAEALGYLYKGTTPESKLRALRVFHEGVKLGSAKCANTLYSEFNGMNLTNGRNIVGHLDKARAERYSKLGDALEFYGGRLKLPNLDKVLPLPPAPLPKWDGNGRTLVDGAKAVTPSSQRSQQGESLNERERIPQGYAVAPLGQSAGKVAGDQLVPQDGYWLALYGAESLPKSQLLPARHNVPEWYAAGERFEPSKHDWLPAERVQWHYLGEAYALPPQRADFVTHMVNVGLLREVAKPSSRIQCNGGQLCPKIGIWEGRVVDDHPLAGLYNRWDQQAFVEKDAAFPNPAARFIDIGVTDIRWTYLGSPNEETGTPGVLNIRL